MIDIEDFRALRRRVRLGGNLITRTGFRIGAQGSHDVASSDNPVVRDGAGRPFIPGSSFKGALRSSIESMVRGLDRERPRACDPLEQPCSGEPNEDASDRPFEEIRREACDVCLFFGRADLAGRILIADMPLQEPGAARGAIEVRDCVAIDRDSETAYDGRKFDLEVVPAGTAFALAIVLDNPVDYQIGLLWAGIESLNEGFSRMGGGGSRGLGRVHVTIENAEVRTAEQMLQGEKPSPIPWSEFAERGRNALREMLKGGM